ncbi:efflux RND transporter periplasmic adaptor subunit [Sphingomonas bacterium]|uniref:efflux RND transporter periplasmic adaptor subunit n=1 Tax=Sphingomonas bacterium TaxID=1895847 RepID=UPI0015767549|nr:efflux RND transporter periplasmic adaptor subunit [Sphingomonas bacterium]
MLALAACSGGGDKQSKGGGAGQPGQGTPQVGYVVLQPSDTPLTTELAGRTSAYENSDVRPQVSGVIFRRLFTEGSLVTKGQALYEIDPRAYRAATNQAAANLASAQANAEATRTQADRYKPLAAIEAVSKQDYTNAVATARQAAASVAQNRAALDTARLNLHFTTVPAPITGRIGRSLFTVGALVSASQTDPLAQIQRLDPIYVDIQQSAAALLGLRRSLASGGVTATSAAVHLKLDDGSDYAQTGAVEFTEALVDQSTGTVTLRARFPNAQGLLLPGMFVRATFSQGINHDAFLLPQQGVSRDQKGNATVMVVGPGNKAVQKPVTTTRTDGAYWVVTSGVARGDKLIVQGLGKLKPGQQVQPVPANTPQKVQAPPPGKGGKQGAGKSRAG